MDLFHTNLFMQAQLTKLEKKVLNQFISGDDVDAKRLRVQIAVLEVKSREYTRVGFTTTFSLPSHVPSLSDDFDINQANVYADHPGVPAGAEFLLESENGKILSLNGHVFVGSWPKNEANFHVLKLNYSLTNPKVEAG